MTLTTKSFRDMGLRDDAERQAMACINANVAYDLNAVLTAGGSARATNNTGIKTVNTLTYLIGGQFASLAATDPVWALGTATSSTVVQVSSFQKYALLLDSANVAYAQEATQNVTSLATVVWTNVSNVGPWAPFLTMVNGATAKCIAAILTIATDATHTFTPGTTALNAAGITATFTDGIDTSLIPVVGNLAGNVFGQTA